jgi:pyrimidine operon attenuation protein / uracil phosphoribosyltransferase
MAETLLLGEAEIRRTFLRLACEIIERNRGLDNVMLAGIERRGVAVAQKLGEALAEVADVDLDVQSVDVTAYRDDRDDTAEGREQEGLDVDGKDVILVDDVLYTGRTVRAALDALIQFGRPRTIQLAVLVDRGHREYPIRPDYVGRIIETAYREHISVDVDDRMAILLTEA